MPQTVEIPDQGIAEFPDDMTPDQIKGVIQKKFYSQPTPTPVAETQPTGVEAATAYGQTLGAPTIQEQTKMVEAIPEPIRKPLEAAAETVSGFIPKTPKEIAGFATPVVGAVETIASTPKKLSDVLFGGKSVAEAFPESQLLAEAERTPAFSKERYKAGFEVLGTLGMGAAIGRGLLQPKLSETLGFEKPQLPTEKIAESAFRLPSGEVVGTGPYHQGEFPKGSEAGFISTSGRFLGREEAGQLATGLKQPLFAEDFVTNHDIVPSLLEHPIAADAIAAGAQKGVPPFTEQPTQGVPNAIQEPVSTQPYGVRAEPQVPQETQAPAASVGSEGVPEIRQGAEVPGGAQEVAQPSEAGSGPVSQSEHLPFLTRASRSDSQIRVSFDAKGRAPTPAEVEKQFADKGHDVKVTKFKTDLTSATKGEVNYRVDVWDKDKLSSEAAKKAMSDMFGADEPFRTETQFEQAHPLQERFGAAHEYGLKKMVRADTGTQPVSEAAPKTEAPTPKLLPGEKQGDLISSTQQEPFALVGEKAAPGTHPTEIAEAGARAQAAEEARLKSEYEQGLLEDVQQYQQQGGDEFLVALKDSGGLPAKSSPHQKFSGELQNIREEYQSGTRKEKIKYSDVFRKDAPDPDVVAQRMRAKGFDVSSDTDLLQMARDRIASGRPAYGSEERGQSLASDWTGATALRPFQPHTEGGFLGSTSGTFKSIAIKKRTQLDAATGQRSERLQKSFTEAERAQKEIRKAAPTDRRQNAISVWMEAGGDAATIDQWASAAKGKMFKRAAEDAKNLSPEEIAIAQKARAAFDVLEQRGNAYDVLTGHRENYVPHIWDVSKKGTGIGSSKLQDRFKFAKARTFDNFFEGDQSGFTPKTMAIGKVLPAYIHEMNRVIADRQFVQDVSDMTASDKRPLVLPRGNAKTVDTTDYIVRDANGQPLPRFQKSVYETQADAQAALKPGQIIEKRPSSSALVNPRGFAKAEDAKGNPIDQRDYKVVDQPALNNWRWVETDPQGGTTILKSDLAVHPELAKRLNAMTGQSAIRQWYNEPSTGISVIPKAIAKGLDTAQSVMKREMFGLLAPFHQVQEGTHAVGHTVNPFSGIPSVERLTPEQADAVRHGLMLLPERTPSQSYMEGIGGKGSFISQASRWLGEKAGQNVVGKALTSVSDAIDGYQDFLFHKYIPGLKFKTYDHILSRNMDRYGAELKRGEVTESDVKALSATQTDAAYGHLNYAQLDRNPTMQHIMQLTLLAPDFLEARARFTGQALKTLAGEKAGAEQFRAIAVLAATQSGAMYTLAHVLGGEWDWKHPFEMTVRGRRYMLRSVPEDLHRLFFQGPDVRREFVSARVNPAAQKVDQLRTGLNYRGEKTGALETMGELLANYIPITARSIPGVRSLTETSRNNPVSPLEQLAGSAGLKISRYSPITKTHQLASEWMDKKGIARDRGSYPVSKFQQLRYALEDGDLDRARGEWEKLAKGGDKSKLAKGFQQSINHPFTGSIKSDAEFSASLDKPNRMIFDHAKEVRKGIMFKFHSIYSGPYGKPKKNVGAAAYVSP